MSSAKTISTRLWCAGALVLIVAAARAEPTRKIRIQFREKCTNAKEVSVVLNGEDRQLPADPDPKDAPGMGWKADWRDPDPTRTFNAVGAIASLRLNGARTDCRRSHAAKDPDRLNAAVALFTFDCNEQPVTKVTIHTDPDTLSVRYVRRLDRIAVVPESVDCVEGLAFAGLRTIGDVRFPSEKLILQIGIENAVASTPGLRINDLPVRHLMGEGLLLDREGVVEIQAAQRGAGNGSAPNLSSNAFDVDIVILKSSGLNQLQLKVE